MRISFNNFQNSLNFTSKNREVRIADDIQRRAKASFPLFSPTYVSEFWGTYNKPFVDTHRYVQKTAIDLNESIKAERLRRKSKLNDARVARHLNKSEEDFLITYLDALKNSGIGKMGNCGENSKIALAGLFANGFYNSKIASLYYKVSMVDKKNGEEIVFHEVDMDHSLAITDMNKYNNRDIVVDPWLGFAAHKSKAFDIYHGYFTGENTEQAKKDCEASFVRNMEYRGIKYNKDDYYMKTEFVFHPQSFHKGLEEKEEAGRQLRERYPELIVKSVK